MKVAVDPSRCQGHAQCVAAAPAVFELGADDLARVRLEGEIAEEQRAAVEVAIAVCPEAAISWVSG